MKHRNLDIHQKALLWFLAWIVAITIVLFWATRGEETELKGLMAYDSYMDGLNVNANFGSDSTGAWGLGTWDYHPWLKDTLIADVPASSTIDSVRIGVYFSSRLYTSSDVTCSLWACTKNATEDGITWNKYDGTNAWTDTGGDYDTLLAVFTTNCGFGADCFFWFKLNTSGTNYFQQLLSGSRSNYGMIGTGSAKKEWQTSESPYHVDSLAVYYTAGATAITKKFGNVKLGNVKL